MKIKLIILFATTCCLLIPTINSQNLMKEQLGDNKILIPIEMNNNIYIGHLRIYIAEIESRWNDAGGNPYHYAALDIAMDKNLLLKKPV